MPKKSETKTLLIDTLQIAVPLWIEKVSQYTDEQFDQARAECAQIIAEKGDIILYKSKKKDETAKAFNRLAEGLAILAHAPGGITFLGQHWEAQRGSNE